MSDLENTSSLDPSEQETGYVRFRRSTFYAAMVPVAFAAGLAAGFLFWGRSSDAIPAPQPTLVALEPATPPAAGDNAPAEDEGAFRIDVSVDDDPALGPSDAPITIVEFSDYRCPYCARFHQETFQALLDTYPDQIRFVYRDLPVVGGYRAALAANCAAEQVDYWAYHDLLFSGAHDLDDAGFEAYAAQLDLDSDEFRACLEDGRYASEVEGDSLYARDLGITGTPTFFINGLPLVGAQPLEVFIQVIDQELAAIGN
jgi:protein-disulfide isomerase